MFDNSIMYDVWNGIVTAFHWICCAIGLHEYGRWHNLPHAGRSMRTCVHCGLIKMKAYP